MDETLCWSQFFENDIDLTSLKKLSEEAINKAKSLQANFPSFIRGFKNGVAEVSWQLIPNGRYYMDENGFGMTSDREIPVYAMIDKELNVLAKFRFINGDNTQLENMRKEAESMIKNKLH